MTEVNHRLPGNSRFVSVGLQMEPAEFDKPGPEISHHEKENAGRSQRLLELIS